MLDLSKVRMQRASLGASAFPVNETARGLDNVDLLVADEATPQEFVPLLSCFP